MCGIVAIPDGCGVPNKLVHRGPDKCIQHNVRNYKLIFTRLSINDVSDAGDQPMTHGNVTCMCNGELYNWRDLMDRFQVPADGGSDCQVIPALLNTGMGLYNLCNALDGVFAFCGFQGECLFAARDPIGVRPLFYAVYDGKYCFASEMKALIGLSCDVKIFPPGFYFHKNTFVSYAPLVMHKQPNGGFHPKTLEGLLVDAVDKRLMSDRPVGFFLSGGLDSSLIAAIGARLLGKIHTFSIGFESGDTPDLFYARQVAEHIGSVHHEVRFTEKEALKALHDVVYALESYDCTTIRASVPMYLLSKYVAQNTDIKVLLSGEGADELFGGYLYLHNAPDDSSFQNECIELLNNVHMFDVLRADRCTAAHGLELRVPFFDKALLQYVLYMNPCWKMPSGDIEKWPLRRAFSSGNWIPDDILYRQKNGMSDAVGYNWVQSVKKYAKGVISEREVEVGKEVYCNNSPLTEEELLYRRMYMECFGKIDNLTRIWRPKWSGGQIDPSAALLDVFKK